MILDYTTFYFSHPLFYYTLSGWNAVEFSGKKTPCMPLNDQQKLRKWLESGGDKES